MRQYGILIFIIIFSCPYLMPPVIEAQQSSFASPYKRFRFDENFIYLRDEARHSDFFDGIKYIPLKTEDKNWYMTLGGEIKLRYEYWKNPNWGELKDEDFLLQRYMLHGDVHLGNRYRIFAQLRSAFKTGGDPPEPIDEDSLDLQQGFADFKLTPVRFADVIIRAGRQELLYGSTRLISVREGANIRRAFDGIKIMVALQSWSIEGWITRPVAPEDGTFNDRAASGRLFWGVYAVNRFAPETGLDLYYLGIRREKAIYDQGQGNEERHTAGLRMWRVSGNWDFDLEFAYQFGSFGKGGMGAWMAATNSGYTFRSVAFTPRLGMKFELASGDRDLQDDRLDTFNPLFHNPHLFNDTDLVGLSNVIDVHPYFTILPAENVRLSFDWAFFWRESVHDAVYNNVMQVQRSGRGSDSRYTGSAFSGFIKWQAGRHVSVYAAYTHFFPGTFIRQSGPDDAADFFGTWIVYKF
ncbi:MAG: alginate export family protein [Syntrophales bacterium]|nr:alginate export family protein [Syntrophales bacterium]